MQAPTTTPLTLRASTRATAEWKTSNDNGLREVGIAFVCAILLSIPILGTGGHFIYHDYTEARDARLAFIERMASHDRLAAAPAGPLLPEATLVHGRDLFESICAACHKADGKGIGGFGKDLTRSWFVASLDDAALRAFLVRGRALNDPFNTTRIPMPPKAGRDDLTDADLSDIITYVRGLQDPRRMPALPPSAMTVALSAPLTADEKAKVLAAAGGDAELAEVIQSGMKIFNKTCIACHGAGGIGIKGNGKTLANNEFVKGIKKDEELLAFVKQGRAPSDPKNTTGIQMPPKGGNPALSDDDILDVIAYLRTLQGDLSTPAPVK